MEQFIRIHEKDNVCVALTDLYAGDTMTLADKSVVLKDKISQGHKFAISDIKEGENVIKYGFPIGHATKLISTGEHVHTHNVATNLGDKLHYEYQKIETKVGTKTNRYFDGYVRENGKVGIRNDIFIIPTVGCVNKIATSLEQIANTELLDGESELRVLAFPHPYGCSQMGDDQEHTREILSDLIRHPNACGVLVLGLGCENSNIQELKKYLTKEEIESNRIRFLVCQEVEDEIEEAKKLLRELIAYGKTFKREKVSVSKLIIGMKCGGSDGFSGITANPTVGIFSDQLIAEGGTTILTEVPEMFGAETILMNRCAKKEIFDKTVDMIQDFKEYYHRHNQVIYENPSPGNKAGGITTLEDKSLGCTQKSGMAPVVDVLSYGECVKHSGLNLLSAPGNDLVASTALAAAGAQLVLFTTGRGTPFAAPVPTMKIATNERLANHKSNWIDFDCGGIVCGIKLEKLAKDLMDEVILIASGKPVKSEIMGYHDMAIFKTGVTL